MIARVAFGTISPFSRQERIAATWRPRSPLLQLRSSPPASPSSTSTHHRHVQYTYPLHVGAKSNGTDGERWVCKVTASRLRGRGAVHVYGRCLLPHLKLKRMSGRVWVGRVANKVGVARTVALVGASLHARLSGSRDMLLVKIGYRYPYKSFWRALRVVVSFRPRC